MSTERQVYRDSRQQALYPPSTGKNAPLIMPDLSLSKNITVFTTSSTSVKSITLL